MQLKFENSELGPEFIVKQKLDDKFSNLWQLMSIFIRAKITERLSSGERTKSIIGLYKKKTENHKIKNLLDQFIYETSDNKEKLESYDSEDSELEDFEMWQKFFTRKFSAKRKPSFNQSAQGKVPAAEKTVTITIERQTKTRGPAGKKGGFGSENQNGYCYPLASIFGDKKPFAVRDLNRDNNEGKSFAKRNGPKAKGNFVYSASYNKENMCC